MPIFHKPLNAMLLQVEEWLPIFIPDSIINVFSSTKSLATRLGIMARLVAMIMLLSLYVGGNTQIGFIHQLIHPDELAAIHNPDEEQNGCHRAQYHGDFNDCDHQFHISKNTTCNLQHTLVSGDQITFVVDCHSFIHHITAIASGYMLDRSSSVPEVVNLRGPPQQFSPS